MTSTSNIVIVILAISTATLAYLYYQSRQNIVEIKLPSVKIERQ